MKQKLELQIIKNFGGYDPDSPFIQEVSILTVIHDGVSYQLRFMEIDSSIEYKITLKEAINRLLDQNTIICGRDLCDSNLDELIDTGECEIQL